MKNHIEHIMVAALFATIMSPPALAASVESHAGTPGHWGWIAEPRLGPKAAPPSHRHVWIPDHQNAALAEKGPGHWQWVSEASFGPRASIPVRRRIWVSAP